jgi:hypothetical protein
MPHGRMWVVETTGGDGDRSKLWAWRGSFGLAEAAASPCVLRGIWPVGLGPDQAGWLRAGAKRSWAVLFL